MAFSAGSRSFPRAPVGRGVDASAGHDYETIAEFYAAIRDTLVSLSRDIGEPALLPGDKIGRSARMS